MKIRSRFASPFTSYSKINAFLRLPLNAQKIFIWSEVQMHRRLVFCSFCTHKINDASAGRLLVKKYNMKTVLSTRTRFFFSDFLLSTFTFRMEDRILGKILTERMEKNHKK